MSRKCSDADFENAIHAYIAGESAQAVAARFHASEKRLTEALKARGLFRDKAARNQIKARKNTARALRRLPLPVDEIAARYRTGESENALAVAFGVSRSAITVRLREAGVPRRDQTTANQLLAAQTPIEEHHRRIQIAQDAVRGRRVPLRERIARARTRQRKALGRSSAEELLERWLLERGVPTIPQQAVGPYNVDLGAYPVAVEIFGGTWHFSRNHAKRFRYLFDAGWHLVIVFVDGRRSLLTKGAADYIVAFLQEASRNPTMGRQYRVIWGEGKLCAAGGADADKLAAVVPRRGRHGRRAIR